MASYRAGTDRGQERLRKQEAERKKRLENIMSLQPGRVTREDIERMNREKAQASSPSHYNLRSQRQPVHYEEEDDSEEYDGNEAQEHDSRRRHENLNMSHRSARDGSHLDYSGNSDLSSTVSDSFSFHSSSSPSAGVSKGRMYPELSSQDDSQETDTSPYVSGTDFRRRGLHSGKEGSPSFVGESAKRIYPPIPSHEEQVEDGICGIPTSVFCLIVTIFVVGLLGVLFINRNSGDTALIDVEEEVSDFDRFSQQLEGLKKRFPGQTERFWKIIRSCTRHVFDPEQATYPAVLLMVGQKKHAVLSSRIAEAVQREFESVKLRHPSQAEAESLNLTSSTGKLNMDDQKFFLDDWLKERLDNDRVAVVVNHLESLLPEAALLLHGYCDGDNAPYKDVLLIFGLFFDHSVHSPQAAEEELRNLWMSEFMRDKIGALLSRIANNIILVKDPNGMY